MPRVRNPKSVSQNSKWGSFCITFSLWRRAKSCQSHRNAQPWPPPAPPTEIAITRRPPPLLQLRSASPSSWDILSPVNAGGLLRTTPPSTAEASTTCCHRDTQTNADGVVEAVVFHFEVKLAPAITVTLLLSNDEKIIIENTFIWLPCESIWWSEAVFQLKMFILFTFVYCTLSTLHHRQQITIDYNSSYPLTSIHYLSVPTRSLRLLADSFEASCPITGGESLMNSDTRYNAVILKNILKFMCLLHKTSKQMDMWVAHLHIWFKCLLIIWEVRTHKQPLQCNYSVLFNMVPFQSSIQFY